ncbi:MAG: helix-hairpin-helix domain-containing protein [Thermoplasmata archaeon]
MEEKQKYFLQGFPNVGEILAQNLLEEFGTLRKVMNARETDLLRVPKIGKKKAREMIALLDTEYKAVQKKIDE